MKYEVGDVVTMKEKYKDYIFFSKKEYNIIDITEDYFFLSEDILGNKNRMNKETFPEIFECKSKIRLEKLRIINNIKK